MKLVSYLTKNNEERVGIFFNGQVYDLSGSADVLGINLPSKINDLLKGGEPLMTVARRVEQSLESATPVDKLNVKQMLAPVPHPPSCRDGYAFRQHVATARRNRGLEMIPEFDQYPVFYFTNHNSIIGEGTVEVESDHLQQLDFELEAAIVIGRSGRNIDAKEADSFIAGYTIMNDFSARVLQMEEMKLNLGPAKGKDFATAIGPWLVTPDELEQNAIPSTLGKKYSLKMKALHNGKQISDGNLSEMNWSFAELIERASYGVTLYPGDVIGSGTVGTGCYLELNGTWGLEAKAKGESFKPIWLQNGDAIELEIEGLGRLKNTIVKAPIERSIIAKKKNIS